MSFLIVLASLCFLMFVAYRGYSVILFAPVAAMGAVLLTDASLVAPMFTGLFMDKMVVFVKLYFPVFLLGAVFGKVIELSGFSKSIVAAVIKLIGPSRAMLAIVLVCGILTYGGVSLFVVVFAVYPFAAEMFRQGGIPKRLIPGTIALGAFTFTMDSIPGTPQIQNIIPTTFFKTDIYAAPVLGTLGGLFILIVGLAYLEWNRRKALAAEGLADPHRLIVRGGRRSRAETIGPGLAAGSGLAWLRPGRSCCLAPPGTGPCRCDALSRLEAHRRRQARAVPAREVDERLQRGLLRHEAQQRRDARHGRRRQPARGRALHPVVPDRPHDLRGPAPALARQRPAPALGTVPPLRAGQHRLRAWRLWRRLEALVANPGERLSGQQPRYDRLHGAL